jgi:hypothetical protein
MKNKKQKEKEHISNLLDIIRNEYGLFTFYEGECPDFTITLPDNKKIGIEETMCCPSASKKGSRRINDYIWQEKVRKEFNNNKYLEEQSIEKKLNILIYTTSNIHKGHHSTKECCKEIEDHLKYVLGTTNTIPSSTLIQHIKVSQVGTHSNVINFNYIARRDAIKAKELIDCIQGKEKKREQYVANYPIWLCVFLPFPENRHPYHIEYDEEYSQESFEQILKNSRFERIYLTSVFKGRDIKCIKKS